MASSRTSLSHQQAQAIERYLHRHAETDALAITKALDPSRKTLGKYQQVLVIPAYKETTDCIVRLQRSKLGELPLLVILVINQPDCDLDTSDSERLWAEVCALSSSLQQGENFHYLSLKHCAVDILLIDRFRQKIPRQQGVGLARKIGADIACQLILEKVVSSPWIYHSDADTHLPDNYFDHTFLTTTKPPSISAAIFSYRHIKTQSDAQYQATRYYEKALAFYVAGLKRAGSPYAYHTLGSCMVTHAAYYCQAHGFPKKAGGEDFYLLNKLAKLGQVVSISNIELLIDARDSDRVPFGTGPAVEKILAMSDPDTQYLYYHPKCFDELGALLSHFNRLFEYKNSQKTTPPSLDHYTPWLAQLSTPLQTALASLGVDKLLQHIDKQITGQQQCLEHCHQWLDAFRTLKLIHQLENHYPKQALRQSLHY